MACFCSKIGLRIVWCNVVSGCATFYVFDKEGNQSSTVSRSFVYLRARMNLATWTQRERVASFGARYVEATACHCNILVLSGVLNRWKCGQIIVSRICLRTY